MALFHSGVSIGLDLQRCCFIFFSLLFIVMQDGQLNKNTVMWMELGYANARK